MSIIVGPITPPVKPASFIAPATALAGFARWAADQMGQPVPTEAGAALADRLAWAADDGDPDEYRPGWNDSYEPSTGDLWGERGYHIGAAGELVDPADAFPEASDRDHLVHGFDFTEGQHQGFLRFARQAGYDAALAGRMAVRPASIPSRFDAAFLLGHYEGTEERIWREAEMANYFAKLDLEQDLWEQEQENRSRMGWPTPACWCPALEA